MRKVEQKKPTKMKNDDGLVTYVVEILKTEKFVNKCL